MADHPDAAALAARTGQNIFVSNDSIRMAGEFAKCSRVDATAEGANLQGIRKAEHDVVV